MRQTDVNGFSLMIWRKRQVAHCQQSSQDVSKWMVYKLSSNCGLSEKMFTPMRIRFDILIYEICLKSNGAGFLLRCERHRSQWILAKRLDDQSASLQKDPVAFVSLNAREEKRVVLEQIVAASPRQIMTAQNALTIRLFLDQNITVLYYPWYSPDLALSVYFLYSPSSSQTSRGPVLKAGKSSRRR